MVMRVLITMMGRSTWGLFNSIWASIRVWQYLPDRAYILTAACDMQQADHVSKMLHILLTEHGSKGEIIIQTVSAEQIGEIARVVKEITTKEKGDGNLVALDVTPGKKATVLGSVLSGMARNDFDHIFYLYIESLKNADRAFLEIPMGVQHPHDILAEVRPRPKVEEG
jgi:hypothetical protein